MDWPKADEMNTIVIVDDEELIRYSLSSLFRDPHLKVLSAATGTAAMKTLQDHPTDLCFLDIHLPDMNGLDIMRTLRDVSPRTRIIVMTGSLITGEMMKLIRAYAHCLISKPFDLDEVGSAAAQLLGARGPMCLEDLPDSSKDSSIVWIDGDWRKHPRIPARRSITCYAVDPRHKNGPVPVKADVLDTSGSGMRIESQLRLEPGSLVRLDDAPVPGNGVVRWHACTGAAETYYAGIQLIAPENIATLMKFAPVSRTDD
jgi:CheY-like chemotaxis protein